MGYDLDRFPDQTVDNELLCSLCHLVLDNPVENLGCDKLVSLDELSSHQDECLYNLDNEVVCDKKCGMIIKTRDLEGHDCAVQLLQRVSSLQQSICVYKLKMDAAIREREELNRLVSEQNSKIKRYQEEESRMENSMAEITTNFKKLAVTLEGIASLGENNENAPIISGTLQVSSSAFSSIGTSDINTLKENDNNRGATPMIVTSTDTNTSYKTMSAPIVSSSLTRSTSSLSLSSMSTTSSRRNRRRCWNCGSPNHLRWECYSDYKIRCYECGMKGHKAIYCDEISD